MPAKSWLLAAAGLLLILDGLAVLWMSGALRSLQRIQTRSATVTLFLASALILTIGGWASQGHAQSTDTDDAIDYSAALETRLAYVRTGVRDVDEISEAGMRGLTRFITTRTALEPGEPVGLDVSQDELSFYALIYWPVDPRADKGFKCNCSNCG